MEIKIRGAIKKNNMQNKKELPLVSVIIPVYNVEKYLTRCLESVIAQTYSNLEIILVDDGSTDNSGKVCDKYQENDSRIKIIHKINGGQSDARNVGIDKACGEYIAFVDSDDWITKDYIESMYSLMITNDCDIATCGVRRIFKEVTVRNKTEEKYKICYRDEAVKHLLYQRISTSAYGKLYKTDLWDAIRFPVGKIYEEIEPLYMIFRRSMKVVMINQCKYMYYYRVGSIVNQKFSLKKMDYVENCKRVLEYVKQDYPQYEKAAISRLMWAEIHVLMHMDKTSDYPEEFNMLMVDIKRYRGIVLKDKDNKLKIRTVAALSFLGYKMLKLVFRMQLT